MALTKDFKCTAAATLSQPNSSASNVGHHNPQRPAKALKISRISKPSLTLTMPAPRYNVSSLSRSGPLSAILEDGPSSPAASRQKSVQFLSDLAGKETKVGYLPRTPYPKSQEEECQILNQFSRS